jgi:integrase
VSGAKSDCSPRYQAQVVIPKKKTGETQGPEGSAQFSGTGALAAAKQWRADALSDLGRGTLTTPTCTTVAEIAEQWLASAEAEPPTVWKKDGMRYKPSYIRTIRDNWRLYVSPEWSAVRLSEISRADVQAWADELVGRGLSGSNVSGAVATLRTLLRLAVRRNLIPRNPVTEIEVPASAGRRERAASPAEVAELLAALPAGTLRAIYTTAAYAGLRRGEIRGLKWGGPRRPVLRRCRIHRPRVQRSGSTPRTCPSSWRRI